MMRKLEPILRKRCGVFRAYVSRPSFGDVRTGYFCLQCIGFNFLGTSRVMRSRHVGKSAWTACELITTRYGDI
jgi:hypothetical protein